MPCAISERDRWKIVQMRAQHENSFEDIASEMGISEKTARRTFSLYQKTGNVRPKIPSARQTGLVNVDDQKYVERLVATFPEYFLDEYCGCFFRDRGKLVSPATMWRTLKKLKFSKTKLEIVAKEQSPIRQAEYVQSLMQYDYSQLVFIDEVHSDQRNLQRKCGWSRIGCRAVVRGHYVRGIKYSSIGGLSLDGMLTHYTIKGGFSCADLLYFLEEFLIPCMKPFPERNSVLVLDNASMHHTESVRDLCESHHIPLLFLPPYSPTFNPIENAFSKIKLYLQRHGNETDDLPDVVALIYLAFKSITSHDAASYFVHCGYLPH